jgi:NAD(P)-dependent dehydrogenase (short-subunit alcohol dehydrogenase family)
LRSKFFHFLTIADIITGGTTGIGFETAKYYLQEGARVIITGQNEGRLSEAASKAAVRSFVRSLAVELGPRGIRINALSPGYVPTEIQGKMGVPREQLEASFQTLINSLPLGRAGRADEIARAAVFLASAESSYITAADLTVDGGFMNI